MAKTLSKKLMDPTQAALTLTADGKASGVTVDNYHRMFTAFRIVNQDKGRNLNPIDHASQWGAWRAYLKAKKKPLGFMDQQGQRLASMSGGNRKGVCGYLVPCDWPADFDEEWTAENDKYASDRFVAAQTKKRDEVKALSLMSSEEKRNAISGSLKRMVR